MLSESCFLFFVAVSQSIKFGQSAPDWQPTFLGSTTLRHAAYVRLTRSENSLLEYEDQWKLFISTFDPLALGQPDNVYYVNSPGSHLDSVSTWNEDQIINYDCSALWPNDIIYMPSDVVGVEGIVQTSGFLVPSKKDGQLQLYDTTVDPPVLLANIAQNDSNEWTYERVHWQDMDLDGDLDAVTARFNLPNSGETSTEFMWFENPGLGPVSAWLEHVISTEGPDINFGTSFITAGGTSYQVFIFAEFFKERITLYWTENEDNNWSLLDNIKSRVIDGNTGQPFDVLIDDFNRDGNFDILATEYNPDIGAGTVKVYFFPEDFRTDEFTSTVIADGFVPKIIDDRHMSPGYPDTYYPSAAYASEVLSDGGQHKPWILLSGDDDGKLYVLLPETDDRSDWNYTKNLILDTEGTTIGSMTHADIDGDGYEEIIVAAYSAGNLEVFTYAP